jgi:hypothetical protein
LTNRLTQALPLRFIRRVLLCSLRLRVQTLFSLEGLAEIGVMTALVVEVRGVYEISE